jgi:hypothetical protein
MTRPRTALILFAAMSLTACAEVVDTWGPSTQIRTEPSVARCDLDGTGLQRVVVTPIRVVLPKAASPVTISCSAEGYRSSKHVLVTTIDGAIAANLLFGSAVGLAIDIMTGAAEQYPSRIAIHLEPRSFTDAARRDEWFGRYRRSVAGRWNRVVENLRLSCDEDTYAPTACQQELAQARTKRAVALEALDRRHADALIRTESQALTPPGQP